MARFKITLTILLFCLFNIILLYSQENIAFQKQVIGSFISMDKLTDGIKSENNYAQIVFNKERENFFIVVLGSARYVGEIKLYWIKNAEPLEYKVELGKQLFMWDKTITEKVKFQNITDNLVKSEINVNGIPAFFVKVTILKTSNPVIKLSEIEIFSSKISKEIEIKNFQIIEVRENSVKVSFESDPPGFGYIRIGESPQSLQPQGFGLDLYQVHSIEVAGLLSGTEYFIQPVVSDVNGKTKMGNVYKFKTKGIPLPRVLKFNFYDIADFNAKSLIEFNVPVKIDFYIRTEKESYKKLFSSENFETKYNFLIEGLIPETKFYCKVKATDQYGKEVENEEEFITIPENIALNKKVYGNFFGTGDIQDFNTLQKITDGNLEEEGLASAPVSADQDLSAIVDLGKVNKIKKIEVIWRGVNFPCKFDVLIGNSMNNFKTVKTIYDAKAEGVKIASKGDFGLIHRKIEINCDGEEARYIKIFVSKNSDVCSDLPFKPSPFVTLAEIKVYKIFDYPSPDYKVKPIK